MYLASDCTVHVHVHAWSLIQMMTVMVCCHSLSQELSSVESQFRENGASLGRRGQGSLTGGLWWLGVWVLFDGVCELLFALAQCIGTVGWIIFH